jgi:integrase
MSIYKRKSGRWAVLIDVDRGADGKRRRRPLGTYVTRKEAERAERDSLSARDRGIDIIPGKVTVRELLTRYLLDRSTRCAAKTMERYHQLADKNIAPSLGSIPLAKLRPAHISEWQSALQQSGGAKGGPLSAKTVFHARSVLHGALQWALQMQLTSRNPCEAVEGPKVSRSTAKALTPAEVSRVLTGAGEGRWGPFVTLAFALGARRGESLALSWADVDFDGKTVTISKSLGQTRAGVALKGTKTDRVRMIALSRIGVDAFRRQRAIQAQDKLRSNGSYKDQGYVFADELGGLISPMAATCAYERIARKAKISSTRLHDARHTMATTLLTGGTDIKTTSGILGHATTQMTLDTYAHLVADAQRDALDRLGATLEKRAAGD